MKVTLDCRQPMPVTQGCGARWGSSGPASNRMKKQSQKMTDSLLQSNLCRTEVNLSPEITPRHPQSMGANISFEGTRFMVLRSRLYEGFNCWWTIFHSRAFIPVSWFRLCLQRLFGSLGQDRRGTERLCQQN